MSEDTSWDVEYYRAAYEDDEHWALRRDFMHAHKHRIAEDQLVCLAQVYVNVTLLGCKYPDKTMEKIAVLGVDVGKIFKEKQKNRLQRTFVKASDAAGDKVKRLKRKYGEEKLPLAKRPVAFVRAGTWEDAAEDDTQQDASCVEDSADYGGHGGVEDSADYGSHGGVEDGNPANSNAEILHHRLHAVKSGINFVNEKPLKEQLPKRVDQQQMPMIEGNKNDPLAEFVIVERNYVRNQSSSCTSRIHDSAMFSSMKYEYHWPPTSNECSLKINDIVIGTGSGQTKKMAKENAAAIGLEELSQRCYTLRIEKLHSSEDEVTVGEVSGSSGGRTTLDRPIGESSIGNKLLKMMGWTGGGLGRDQSGIKEPIRPSTVFGRAGLGHSAEQGVTKKFRQKIREIIGEYSCATEMKDLAFSPEFSKEQRAEIHKIARQFRLKSASHGKDDERYLVLSRKFSAIQLINRLLQEGPNDKYTLIPPTQK